LNKRKKDSRMPLLFIMLTAYAMGVGATINGVFRMVGSGGKDPEALRTFLIAICFIIAATILRRTITRRDRK